MKSLGLDINWLLLLDEMPISALSGSGRLPLVIDTNELLFKKYHKELMGATKKCKVRINPHLKSFVQIKEEDAINILTALNKPIEDNDPIQTYLNKVYSTIFCKYAQKGFFAFDRTLLNDYKNCTYHLVAYPEIDIDRIPIISIPQALKVSPNHPILQTIDLLERNGIDFGKYLDFARLK